MTKGEIAVNWTDVKAIKIKEIQGLFDLGCFQRHPRAKSHNIIDARWAITWKMIEGNVGVECRLTVRGFKDKSQDLDTYVGTTTRSGQRLVNAVAAENEDFILFSFDVSQAFAKGLNFQELSKLTGTERRAVEFDVPRADFECLKSIKGFESFNPATEILTMLKPIYGLKDAPRAWRKKLHQVLAQWQSCQQLQAEPELYCVHTWRPQRIKDPVGRAKAHELQQQEVGSPRNIEPSKPTPGNLQCLLSVLVYDIKGTAPKAVAESLLAHLNASVGSCKADRGSFLHIGIQHGFSLGVVFTHQYVYVDSIKLISSDLHIGKEDEALCDAAFHEAYRSVLGAVAWTVLTRAELVV